MTTVILINPMGADITALVPSLLQGSILQPGDELYTLPYNNNAGAVNIAGGVTLLDDKLNETSGDILVIGYSEGCQVATKWMRDHGQGSPITPTTRLKFLLIANSCRKYGGVLYGHNSFSGIADVGGLPAVVPYATTDFARQYDGYADFCTGAPDVQTALDEIDNPSGNDAVALAIEGLVRSLANNGDELTALQNSFAGMSVIHTDYFDVTLDATDNVSYTDVVSPNVEYIWAPTYPVPLLGTSKLFSDQPYRKVIERFFDRPAEIPLPDYAGGVQTWSRKPPVTGWWPVTEPSAPKSLHVPPMVAAASLPMPKAVSAPPSQLPFKLPSRLSETTGLRHVPPMIAAASAPTPVSRLALPAPASALANASFLVPTISTGTPPATPTFDTIGGGFVSPSATPANPSFVLPDTGDGVIAFLQAFCNASAPTIAATVGGAAMTQLGSPILYLSTSGYYALLYAFGLIAPPSGSKTVAFTISGPTAADYLANAMSFHNVTSFGTPVTASAASGNPAMSVSSAAGKMIAQFFGGYTTTFTSYNQTEEYNKPLGGANLSAVMGYAAGAPSVSFTAVGSQPWGGIAVPIQ